VKSVNPDRSPLVSRMSSTAALSAALVFAISPGTVHASESGYDYAVLLTSGDPVAGGDTFGTGFETWSFNDRGQLAFDVGLVPSGAVGVFRYDRGRVQEIVRSGQPAPGGGAFVFPTTMSMNQSGDVAFTEVLTPTGSLPRGVNWGVYAYSPRTGAVRAVLAPGVSQAPNGSIFRGAYYHDDINDSGAVSFSGIFPTPDGIVGNPSHLGTGMFRADPDGAITAIATPGDLAPGGGKFDFVYNTTINDRGDAAFGGHIAGEECIDNPTDPTLIHCTTGVYLKRSGGPVVTIAHPGDPAPRGGIFRQASGANINSSGNVAFNGDLTPAPAINADNGVFLYLAPFGRTIALARPGDAMPGGGTLLTIRFDFNSRVINSLSQVAFRGFLDSVTNGTNDQGAWVWSFGVLRLVARTGMIIPGLGKIAALVDPLAFSPLALNDLGQVAFRAKLDDGRVVVLLATPHS